MISFFIPIRKGSKRVKNKNTKPIGKFKLGLLEIKIKQLKKLIKINKKKHNLEFIVSTDSKRVENYCKKFNWIKIHKRNKALSGDHSLQKIINLAPKICNGKYILWTHVTSPLFTALHYKEFIDKYLKKKSLKKTSAFSADMIQKFLYSNKNGWLSHKTDSTKWPRTQDLEPLYVLNSAAIIAHKITFIKEKNRICKNPIPIITKIKSGFDVDNKEDFTELRKTKIFL
jgi:CMP-N-acetylneuraminic acid synthetase